MKRFSLILTFVLCWTRLWAQTLYVPTGQYPTIQSAINAAGNGDVVIVSPATYYENINFCGKAITVRSVNPDDPNVVAATVINGSHPADPNIGSVVTFASGEDTNSVLSGFTITGGTGSWLLVSWEFKGLCWNRCGGGVVCYNMSAPTISKNVFINNIAGQGGGVYIYGDPVNPNDPSDPPLHIGPIIADNTFIANSAIVNHGFSPPDTNYPNNDHGDGGAIVAFQGCDANITGNLIKNNYAEMYGGGIHLRQWSNGLIEDNQLIGNESALGAGLHITYISAPTVRLNLIKCNIAGGLGGGGIYIYYLSRPLIERNVITNNTSSNGAGIGVYYDSAPLIRDNLIYKNNSGAGIRVVGSLPTITHNTIADNFFGGINCDSTGAVIIENNIISSNGHGWGIWVDNGSSPLIRYNSLWANQLGTCGPDIPDQTGINGNISLPPNFVAPDNNDYHLNYNSLCINAGDPNYIPQPDVTDYEGDNRLMGQYVDIGADEARPLWNITSAQQYQTIQQAIDDANDGDVIFVTVGTHTGPGNRDIDFKGKAITLRSFDPNNPDVVAATIIDCNGSDWYPHRGFHFHSGEDANSVLAGLTITRGGGVYDGGGIRCLHSSPTIRNCIITGNVSDGRGTVYCGNYSNPTIINCTITNNIATAGYGAGICCWDYSSPTILNCTITGNSAQSVGRHGGGIYCHNYSNAVVASCFISGNSAAHRGGGLAVYWSAPVFANCTVVGNRSLEGGGISSFRESNPTVTNCIVLDNRAPEGPQLALINTIRVWQVSIPTEMTVLFSDIQGGQSAACVDNACILHWGQGNIDADPNFAQPGYWDDANTPADTNDDFFVIGDFHIIPTSPCVDAADNNSVPPASNEDLDGEERIFDGTVDMGADELTTNPLDLNNDGVVDYLELAVLVDEWLRGGSQLQTDFHKDNFVDLLDYVELANQWLWKGRWHK
jgi:parallel beta-helix repeat protein